MKLSDEDLMSENIENINKITTTILLFSNLLGPAFYLLSYFGIFSISTMVCAITVCLVTPFSIIHLLCVYKFNLQKFSMYFGLAGMSLILGFLGSHFHVGIYISYSLIVFMSCLYYDTKLTAFIAVFDYIVMLVSLWFKGMDGYAEGNPYVPTVAHYFLAMGAGFTIEFFFVFLIAINISKRSRKTLQHALDINEQLRNTQLDVMDFIPKILESHEVFTGHHVRHTVKYVEMISKELKREGVYADILDDETIDLYAHAANLHDIGKVHIPDNILNNPGKFTPEEYAMMKSHPEEGKKLIMALPRIKHGKFNEIAIQMAYYHHEKYDGTGYPTGISGKAIPLCARIMTAADVLDALLSWRPYKDRMEIDQVMQTFEEGRGTHFEPCIVDAVLALKPMIYMVSQDFKTKEIEEEEKEYYWRQRLKQGKIDALSSGNQSHPRN